MEKQVGWAEKSAQWVFTSAWYNLNPNHIFQFIVDSLAKMARAHKHTNTHTCVFVVTLLTLFFFDANRAPNSFNAASLTSIRPTHFYRRLCIIALPMRVHIHKKSAETERTNEKLTVHKEFDVIVNLPTPNQMKKKNRRCSFRSPNPTDGCERRKFNGFMCDADEDAEIVKFCNDRHGATVWVLSSLVFLLSFFLFFEKKIHRWLTTVTLNYYLTI